MPSLSLTLLGGFYVEIDGRPISTFESNKVRALLVYLAVETGRPLSRSKLAGLLWPDHSEEAARTNLRHVVRQLRQSLPDLDGAPLLITSRQTIQLNPDYPYTVDAARFAGLMGAIEQCNHPHLAACPACVERCHEVAALYRGEFLAGFRVPDSDLFEEWLFIQRETLHRQAMTALYLLTGYHEDQGNYEQARQFAWHQIELEPWREEAHRQLMRVLARSGQRTAALAQYAQCCKMLADELGVDPAPETVALYEQIRTGTLGRGAVRRADQRTGDHASTLSPPPPAASMPRQDWGEAPADSNFYDRRSELERLDQWLNVDRCRLIVVLGMGGMGKTTLVAKAARENAERFDFVFWRSLLNAPPITEFLRPCVRFLARQQLTQVPETLNEQMALLFDYLAQHRCLLVLDNVESILEMGQAGQYQPGYEGYGQFIDRIVQHDHQSCLVLTSRERPRGTGRLAEDLPAVRIMSLNGLSAEGGQALLQARGLVGNSVQAAMLVQRYSGNPLALKLIARTIQELFDGDLATFLDAESLMAEGLIFDDIRVVLDQQFARLSALEREILIWLAIEREAVPLPMLVQDLVYPPTQRALLEALRALQRRSLLERTEAGFTLQNVIIEYITDYLIQQIVREIVDFESSVQSLKTFNRFALLKAQAKGYVRQSQERMIVQPLAAQLMTQLGQAGLARQVQRILAALQDQVSDGQPARGYAGGNLLNLLLHLGLNPAEFDFSQLCVWQACLRGKYVPGLNLAGSDLSGSVFTYIFGYIHALQYSEGGDLLAYGSSEGMLQLWRVTDGHLIHAATMPDTASWYVLLEGDRYIGAIDGDDSNAIIVVDLGQARVLHTFSGHRSPPWRVSAHGAWIASGDASGQVCVWEARSGRLLHRLQGHRESVSALAITVGGGESHLLASADVSGIICLWALPSGRLIRRFQAHGEEVAVLRFALDGAILASGSHDHTVRLWDVQGGTRDEPVRQLCGYTRPVRRMEVDPTGRILAAGGVDTFITLWDVQSGQALHTVADNGVQIHAIAFNLDGSQVAVLDVKETIEVWDVRTGQQVDSYRVYHRALQAIAVSPDGRLMISAGADGVLYLWDISTPEAVRFIARLRGHRQRVKSIAFSRDGVTVASGDHSGEIRIWDIRSGTSHALPGHEGVVSALAFHPDGRRFASAGADGVLRIWDAQHRVCQITLSGHTNVVSCCDFSPDGRWLASGSLDRTVLLWDAKSGELRHTLRQHSNAVAQICFSPDGQRLVSSSYDLTFCLWDVTSGALLATRPTYNTAYLALTMHPNGRILVAGGRDHTIRLVEIDSGQTIEELHGHSRTVEAVSITRGAGDTLLLITAGHDETTRIWDITAVGTAPNAAVCLASLRTPGPYAGMNITGVTGITAGQKAALQALGATVEGSAHF